MKRGDPKGAERAEERQRKNTYGTGFTKSTPEAEGIDGQALATLVEEAARSHASALVVLRNGRVVYESYFGGWSRPIELMSATKTFAGLAAAFLLEDHPALSLDTPIASFFPEWRGGPKAGITLRHVLNHTSGLRAMRDDREVTGTHDSVRLALDADLEDAPGSRFFYNNKAVNLVWGIIEHVAHQGLDTYLMDRLFSPLGIHAERWQRDPAGHAYAFYGLQMDALDVAKIGQFLLDGGKWQGQQLISAARLRPFIEPSQPFDPTYGLLFWLLYDAVTYETDNTAIDDAVAHGFNTALALQIRPLVGRRWRRDELRAELTSRIGTDGRSAFWTALASAKRDVITHAVGPVRGYYAAGSWGNFMVVVPSLQLVAVRMAEWRRDLPESAVMDWSFPNKVLSLVKLVK